MATIDIQHFDVAEHDERTQSHKGICAWSDVCSTPAEFSARSAGNTYALCATHLAGFARWAIKASDTGN